MPKRPIKAEVNTFVKGLITEASPMNYPPDASVDEENFDLKSDGTRSRRKGFDIESGGQYRTVHESQTSLVNNFMSVFRWEDAGGVEGRSLTVVQTGRAIDFYDTTKQRLSSDGFLARVDIPELSSTEKFSFASVDNRLVVASNNPKIAVIEHDGNTGFTVTFSRIRTRDLWGIEVKGKPLYETDRLYRGSADTAHYYNLQNQSWGIPRKNKDGVLSDPIQLYAQSLIGGKVLQPSNSETVWPALQFQPVPGGEPFQRIYPDLFGDSYGMDTLAAKGFFIIDALDRGNSRLEERNRQCDNDVLKRYLTAPYAHTFPVDRTEGGCTIVSQFSGRVFFAGFSGKVIDPDSRSPSLNNYVFFSQLVRSRNDITNCFQEGDPTSKENNDILDTDGGFIRISGADRILNLVALDQSLIVIASNGVWSITGGSDYGFSATNYRVDKVSNIGCISSRSVVYTPTGVLYWSEDGINAIGKNQLGDHQMVSLSDATIRTFYQDLSLDARKSSVGVFDNIANKVRWLYENDEGTASELILDLILQAFYSFRINFPAGAEYKIVSPITVPAYNTEEDDEGVYVGLDPVYADTEQVGLPSAGLKRSFTTVKYLVQKMQGSTIQYSFAHYYQGNFRDFYGEDFFGVDAKAYMLTGTQTAGDTSLQKQIQYLTLALRHTEKVAGSYTVPTNTSSCLYQVHWDFANSAKAMKWSALKQGYRFQNRRKVGEFEAPFEIGKELVVSKNMVRGRGRSMALYFESEPFKDLQLVGWNIGVDGNSYV